jgi:hypothetical protein
VRITNWWTGAYELASERPLPAAIRADPGAGIGPPLAVAATALVALGALVMLWTWLAGAL